MEIRRISSAGVSHLTNGTVGAGIESTGDGIVEGVAATLDAAVAEAAGDGDVVAVA
jgi:hypothetical protein